VLEHLLRPLLNAEGKMQFVEELRSAKPE